MLADGGNAVDAAVAAALVAGVVAVSQCGIGGYGGHMVVARPSGQVMAIDFNSSAPSDARPDMYPLDAAGHVKGGVNSHGWLAAGVPGTLAGLQLALDRFGSRSLDKLIEPAIRFARDGFPVTPALATVITRFAPQFRRDAGSARLFIPGGNPWKEGEQFRNPDLAAMLERFARDNSVAAFYRGDIAQQIAAAFAKNGGLVTADDLRGYEAVEVPPLKLPWRGATICTAPLTAGGLSVLQVLAALKTLDWSSWDPADPRTLQARIEAMRLAWHDRLTLLGDPASGDVPVARLLSDDYAAASAERIRRAVDAEQMIPAATDGRTSGGTIHLSSVDKQGMMAAVTLTHGEGFARR